MAGNTNGVRHGAFSAVLVAPLAAEALSAVDDLCAGTPAAQPAFRAAREALALRLARLRRVTAYLDEKHDGSPLTHKGGTLKAAKLEAEMLGQVERLLGELGLTPMSAGKLGVDLHRMADLGLERLVAEGRRIREEAGQ